MPENDDKRKEELKQKLYKLIDSIEDEHVLNVLNEEVVPYVIENRTKEQDEEDEELTEEQVKQIESAIKEAKEGKTMNLEEFKQRMSKWITE